MTDSTADILGENPQGLSAEELELEEEKKRKANSMFSAATAPGSASKETSSRLRIDMQKLINIHLKI